MKRVAIVAPLAALVSLLGIATSSHALEPPRVIPHSASVNKPVSEIFQTLKLYFADRLESKFILQSADEKTGTIVAKQTGIDSDRWRNWAACNTDPMHMIYQLNDAMVTVTIKLDQSVHNTTFMTVSADFQGIYGLSQDQTTIECRSTGALEDNILALAGAQMPGAQTSTAPATQAH
jgi:methionine-rich copper-binding protein CopC